MPADFFLPLPADVAEILEQLHAAGHTAEVVGGCVRSLLLHTAVADWDICTSALPAQVQACFSQHTVHATGLAHGTVTLVSHGCGYEITTYRTESTYTDHRRPDAVHFAATLEEDLSRRDFTVNAMAYSPRRGLVDCYHGREDLAAKTLRCVGSPAARFTEDALRILRALRFASTLGFALESATARAAAQHAHLLAYIARERVYAELTKLLCGQAPGPVLLQHAAVLQTVLPCPLAANASWWQHTAAAVQSAEARPCVRWAVLLHAAAAPHASVPTRAAFPAQAFAAQSAQAAQRTLAALRAPCSLLQQVPLLVECHAMPLTPSLPHAARLLHRLGPDTVQDLLAVKCALLTARPGSCTRALLADALAFAACVAQVKAQHIPFAVSQLAVTGSDVLALGVPAGPAVGNLLNAALQQAMAGNVANCPAALLEFIKAQLPIA